jgi:hypothetical protein
MQIFSRRDTKILQECDLLLTSAPRRMRHTSVIALLALGLLLMTRAIAQTPNTKEGDELNALISELQSQQRQIVDNQAKIEEKLVTLGDTIREARIFSSRAGH